MLIPSLGARQRLGSLHSPIFFPDLRIVYPWLATFCLAALWAVTQSLATLVVSRGDWGEETVDTSDYLWLSCGVFQVNDALITTQTWWRYVKLIRTLSGLSNHTIRFWTSDTCVILRTVRWMIHVDWRKCFLVNELNDHASFLHVNLRYNSLHIFVGIILQFVQQQKTCSLWWEIFRLRVYFV